MADMENQSLEIGDVITLDDENGELLGDFEVVAIFEMDGKDYVALTAAQEEAEAMDGAASEPAHDHSEEIDLYVFRLEGEELVPLEAEEEEAAYARLDGLLEDIELLDRP